MLYDKDPCSPPSIFPIDSEGLTELVRVTFCLNHQGHAKYKERVERHFNHDPAKVILLSFYKDISTESKYKFLLFNIEGAKFNIVC